MAYPKVLKFEETPESWTLEKLGADGRAREVLAIFDDEGAQPLVVFTVFNDAEPRLAMSSIRAASRPERGPSGPAQRGPDWALSTRVQACPD